MASTLHVVKIKKCGGESDEKESLKCLNTDKCFNAAKIRYLLCDIYVGCNKYALTLPASLRAYIIKLLPTGYLEMSN
jgi:hypothetical protein